METHVKKRKEVACKKMESTGVQLCRDKVDAVIRTSINSKKVFNYELQEEKRTSKKEPSPVFKFFLPRILFWFYCQWTREVKID